MGRVIILTHYRRDIMKVYRLLVAGIFVCTLASLGSGVALAGSESVATAAAQPIAVTASNWKFSPAEITVHVNQPVTLKLSSSEGVHGFASPDLGINNTMLAPGSTKTVTFTPTKPGTYAIHCSMMCGQGHADMTFIVKVVA